jgi:hypothetical protein
MAKQLIGIVSSNKGDKTIVVTVQTRKTHPLYRKQYTVSKKFMAHDAKNEAQPGDKGRHCRNAAFERPQASHSGQHHREAQTARRFAGGHQGR